MTAYEFKAPDGSSVRFDVSTPQPEVSGVEFTAATVVPGTVELAAAPLLLLGAGCKVNNVLTGTNTYDPWQQIGLAFNSPSKGLSPAPLDTGAQHHCMVLAMYRDPATPALLKPWLDKVYALGLPTMLNYWQEVNRAAAGFPAPGPYRANVAAQLDIVAEHPAGQSGLVTCVEKFSWFPGINGDWRDYWTGLPILWDRYSSTGYPPADSHFAGIDADNAEAAADPRIAGRPWWWGMGEMGLTWQKTSDPSGQGQADAISSYVGNRQAAGAEVIILWDGPGTDHDYTCSPPAQQAYRGLCAANVAAG